MQRRFSFKITMAAAIFGVFVGVGGATFAATASSAWYRYTHANVAYEIRSTIDNSSRSASTTNSRVVGLAPNGHMGVRARSYKAGTLCQASAWRYNSGGTHSMATAARATCGRGSYSSLGQGRAWNTSSGSYWTQNSRRSPSLNVN